LLRVQCYEVTTFSETETKMKLRCNVHDDVTVKEKCNIQSRAERYSLIAVLSSALFWVTDFWWVNYTAETVFCEVSDAATIIKQAFSIKFINNGSSAAWESNVQKDGISSSERLSKYNCIYM